MKLLSIDNDFILGIFDLFQYKLFKKMNVLDKLKIKILYEIVNINMN